ncbi:MAG: YciI family protein [Fimbriimonas sp.]
MRYMLLIYGDENTLSEEALHACYEESGRLVDKIREKGQFLAAAPLQKTSTARSVRVREGRALVTDGPFAETHEQLGGYYLVEAEDIDEAISIASRIPGAKIGTVEVRPVVELPYLP